MIRRSALGFSWLFCIFAVQSSLADSPPGWSANPNNTDGVFVWSKNFGRTDDFSVKIQAKTRTVLLANPGWKTEDPVPIDPNITYEAAVWTYTPDGGVGHIPAIQFFNSDDTFLGTIGAVGPSGFTDPDRVWVPKQFSFRAADFEGLVSAAAVRFLAVQDINATQGTATTVFFDDVILRETVGTKPGPNLLPNSSFAEHSLPDPGAVFGGIPFPAGAASFADKVVKYDPTFRGGDAPDETQQDARQILGIPEQGEMSLGRGGRIRVQFLDNSLTGSNNSQPDLYIFEVGAPETTIVDISKDDMSWFRIGTASGFASGIDIDQFGFDSSDRFSYVRITDDGDWTGDHHFTAGADLVAVGARSSGSPVDSPSPINYRIQAHVGGRSELIIQRNRLQWHHLKGPAPGLERQFWNPGRDANSPTIIDSNLGPNITWVPEGWPINLGNGTHPESYSTVFNGLTPVFPNDGRCWRLEKEFGDGEVEVVQQPNASNGYSLVIRFDDLVTGIRGGRHNLAGSGFYSVKLSRTFKTC